LSPTLLLYLLEIRVPSISSLGSINLLGCLIGLRKTHTSLFMILIKEVIKNIDEQPDVEAIE
jgi:hypothetical protein